jgi:hypothetical protein
MRPPRSILLLSLLATLSAGCGEDEESTTGADTAAGGGTAGGQADPGAGETVTFDQEGFAISFEYPSDFDTSGEVSFERSAGTSPAATAALALDGENLLALQRFDLNVSVTPGNLDRVQGEADALFSQLAGEQLEGERTEVAGLPALEYEIALQDPPEAETRAIAIFDGATEYLLNCQSTPDGRERIEQACELALDTLEPK